MEVLWKQRFESLCQEMEDIKRHAAVQELEVSDTRAWDAPEEVYVSFQFDVVGIEKKAIELWGDGKYDVYKLVRAGETPFEKPVRIDPKDLHGFKLAVAMLRVRKDPEIDLGGGGPAWADWLEKQVSQWND